MKSDFGLGRMIVAIAGLVLVGGTILATTSARISSMEVKLRCDKELWEAQLRSLKESVARIEKKVDRLLELDRLARGDEDGN